MRKSSGWVSGIGGGGGGGTEIAQDREGRVAAIEERAVGKAPIPFPARARRRGIGSSGKRDYIMPAPGGIGGVFSFSSGISVTAASVVMRSEAIDAAFWIAQRTTFVGSMMPASKRFS